jgi:hypothetical protein
LGGNYAEAIREQAATFLLRTASNLFVQLNQYEDTPNVTLLYEAANWLSLAQSTLQIFPPRPERPNWPYYLDYQQSMEELV